jgi:hypothetical protein
MIPRRRGTMQPAPPSHNDSALSSAKLDLAFGNILNYRSARMGAGKATHRANGHPPGSRRAARVA